MKGGVVTNNFDDAIPFSDVVLITVPTPVDESNKPDLGFVISASKSVLQSIDRESKTIVALESTVYPESQGRTRENLR